VTPDNNKNNNQGAPLERCVVVQPRLKGAPSGGRSSESRLEEACGLARAIGLDVAKREVLNVNRPQPSTLLGRGAVERIAGDVEEAIDVVVVDTALTPVQQRNLENAWKCKVIDRTGLILEIFGERARTAEGRLQVELAALTFQRSRLVRSWTHLERQRGGAGFMGGPGERQIETDRRLIDQRITRLKRQLVEVKRTRQLHRKARKRVPYPVVALVGYTNAGKSTLFNRLTGAEVEVRDQLFATLDPTMRELVLPSGRRVILSDTVGFISGLPHELVEAFHATLEEVMEADLILHVRDAACADRDSQKADVLTVLGELGLEETLEQNLIEVLNKIDLLAEEEREILITRANRTNAELALSAIGGEGCDDLLRLLDQRLAAAGQIIEVDVPPSDGALLSWLYQHGEVLERSDTDDAIHISVRMDPANAERLRRKQGAPS